MKIGKMSMGWFLIVALGVVVAAAVAMKWWKGSKGTDMTQAQLLERMKQPDCIILDVRSADEYASGHVPGARHISHNDISNHLDELEPYKDKDVIIYCEHGFRARIAQGVLVRGGFLRISHLIGDMARWRAEKLPVEVSTGR